LLQPLGELGGGNLFVGLPGSTDNGALEAPLDDRPGAKAASVRVLALERAAAIVDLGAQAAAA
jgi:hypothetical protein